MKKNIIFMGTPDFSANILDELNKHHNISLVITQVDKAVGRKKVLTPSPVKNMALKLGLELNQPKKIKDNEEFFNLIKSKNPDYIIVAAYGKILPKELLDLTFCINTHASLLPLYRGASPIQTSILNGDKYSGVTLMKMDEGLDTGDILYQEKIDISNKKSQEVFSEMSNLSAKMLLKYLENPSEYKAVKQNNQEAIFTKIIKKDDGLVILDDAEKIYYKYLAFNDWPNVFLENGLKLMDLELNEKDSENDFGIIKEIKKDSAIISCKKGSLELFKVQAPGKKVLDIKSYLNGKRLKVGDRLV